MDRLTERHKDGTRWIVRTHVPGKDVGDVPHDGCDLNYQFYSGKIIDRLGELEEMRQAKKTTRDRSNAEFCPNQDCGFRLTGLKAKTPGWDGVETSTLHPNFCPFCGQAIG